MLFPEQMWAEINSKSFVEKGRRSSSISSDEIFTGPTENVTNPKSKVRRARISRSWHILYVSSSFFRLFSHCLHGLRPFLSCRPVPEEVSIGQTALSIILGLDVVVHVWHGCVRRSFLPTNTEPFDSTVSRISALPPVDATNRHWHPMCIAGPRRCSLRRERRSASPARCADPASSGAVFVLYCASAGDTSGSGDDDDWSRWRRRR